MTETDDTPTDSEVVETGATAARELVLSRFETDEVRDLDVTVAFEDGVLEVDVYLDVPEPGTRDSDRVADDAALAARRAVDRLFEGDTNANADADTNGA